MPGNRKKKRKGKKKARSGPRPDGFSDALNQQLDSKEHDNTIEGAEMMLSRFQGQEAVMVLRAILDKNPEDTNAMDLLAQALLEIGQEQEAQDILAKSVELAPDGSATKYFYLGQMLEGYDALNCFQKGVELLERDRNDVKSSVNDDDDNNNNDDVGDDDAPAATVESINEQISTAYCSMVELLTSDLCDEDGAEQECEDLLSKAIEICPDNPEPYQSLCNLRIIQGKLDEAKESLHKVFDILRDNDITNYPYPFKTTTCKYAMELGLFTTCAELLTNLLEEDDRYVEVWYLQGLCHCLQGSKANALLYLRRAHDMLQRAPDPDLQAAIDEAVDNAKALPEE